MNVEMLMTKNVRVCRPEDTLEEAARAMWDYDCGCVPVLDADERVVGVITDRDVCMSAWSQGRTLREIPVAAAMSWKVLTCKPTDQVELAEDIMRTNQVRRLPVVDDDGKLAGLISLADVAREATREMFLLQRDVEGMHVAATLAAVTRARRKTVDGTPEKIELLGAPVPDDVLTPAAKSEPRPEIKLESKGELKPGRTKITLG